MAHNESSENDQRWGEVAQVASFAGYRSPWRATAEAEVAESVWDDNV